MIERSAGLPHPVDPVDINQQLGHSSTRLWAIMSCISLHFDLETGPPKLIEMLAYITDEVPDTTGGSAR
jgi:hypothetical protein